MIEASVFLIVTQGFHATLEHLHLAYKARISNRLLRNKGILRDSPTFYCQSSAVIFLCSAYPFWTAYCQQSLRHGKFLAQWFTTTLKINSIWRFFDVHHYFIKVDWCYHEQTYLTVIKYLCHYNILIPQSVGL